MSQKNPLYLMVKPPLPVAFEIQDLPETDWQRGAALLHCTIQPLGDCLDQILKAIIDAINRGAFEPFRLVFDQLAIGRGARLISSERLRGAERFHTTLVRTLAKAGIILPPYRSRPHITLNYHDMPRPGTRPIDPISWEVTEIMLVKAFTAARVTNI